jgi:calcineurin-like phosphoesterase family protein
MRFFTSDWHIGHENIIKFCDRPFASVKDMNQSILNTMNRAAGPEDELWILGDLAMGDWDASMNSMKQLVAGKIFLVPGNHDKCHPMHKKAEQYRNRYVSVGMEITAPHVKTHLEGQPIWVSHFPYVGDSGYVDRFVDWRLNDTGSWLVCGHVHEKWRQMGRQINVGVDAWGGNPVSEDTIKQMIKLGPADINVMEWKK